MSSPSRSRSGIWRPLLGLALAAAVAAVVMSTSTPEPQPEVAQQTAPHRDRARTSDEPQGDALLELEAPAREVAIRAVFGAEPVRGARVQVVPLDAPHGSVAPACACEPDGGVLDDGTEEPEDADSALDESCGSCAPSLDALFELAERGAGFLSSAEGTTDDQGVARIAVEARFGVMAIWVTAAGLSPGSILAEVQSPGAQPQEVQLAGLHAQTIRVQDADGDPVETAEVAAFSDQPFQPLTSAIHGSLVRLPGLPGGVDVHLIARAPGFLPAHVILDPDDDATTLTLERPRTLVGRVLHLNAPVAGAAVTLTGDDLDPPRTARSDADGRFTFAGIGPGSYTLEGELGALRGGVVLDIADAPGEVALLLVEMAHVEGVVTDAASDAPVRGATVELRAIDPLSASLAPQGSSEYFSAESDAAGHFALEVAPGAYSLRASDASHPELVVPVEVREGEAERLTLRMNAGMEVSGTVSDSHGAPVAARLRIEATESHELGDEDRRVVTAEASGHFVVKGLRAGAHVLTATAEGHPQLTVPLRLPVEGPVSLTMKDGAALEGRVLGPDGPLTGAMVELGDRGRHAVTDAAGAFHFDAVPAGACTVIASAAGMAASDPVPAQLAEGQTAHVEVRLAPGMELRGRVVDDLGKPVADALVEAHPANPVRGGPTLSLSATTQASGAFTLSGLRDDDYRVLAYHDGLTQASPTQARPGAGEVVLTLLHGARIAGRVISRDGQPVHRFSVEGEEFHAADGRFTLSSLSPDAAEIYVEGAFPTVRLAVQVRPGELTDVGDVLVDSGQALNGLVLDPEGRPAAGIQVTALPPAYDTSNPDVGGIDPTLDSPRTVATDAQGRFEFAHLRPGTYLVQASGAASSSEAVHAATGTTVRLQLQPGATLRGRASLTDGTPVDEGTAIFVGGAVTVQARVVGGAFELSGLPAGVGQVLVTSYAPAAGHVSGSHPVTLAAGQSADVALTLGSMFHH